MIAALFDAIPDRRYWKRALTVDAVRPIGYWPFWEPSGIVAADISGNARNGSHTGVTLGQTGISDGRTSPLFDGANDYTNVYTAGLAGAFNGAEGSIDLWGKGAPGVWMDATNRHLCCIRVNANNAVQIYRGTTNNELNWYYAAGGTVKTAATTVLAGTLNWFHLALTWSKSADSAIFYVNGAQIGATLTGLGVWAGALGSTQCTFGALLIPPTQVWSGYLAHAAIWSKALTAPQIARLAKARS
jgi:hypothetical protein